MKADSLSKQKKIKEEAVSKMDSLYRIALYLTLDEGEAERLLELTYTRTFRFLHLYREDATIGERLYSMMLRLYKEDSNGKIGNKPEDSYSYLQLKNEYGEEITKKMSIELLRESRICFAGKVLASMPDKYRIPLILIDMENMEFSQAGYVMGISLKKLVKVLRKGRDMAAKKLWSRLENRRGAKLVNRMIVDIPKDSLPGVGSENREREVAPA